jgi:hypothetical protein
MTFKGFYDENAITEDLLFDMKGRTIIKDYKKGVTFFFFLQLLDLHSNMNRGLLFHPHTSS